VPPRRNRRSPPSGPITAGLGWPCACALAPDESDRVTSAMAVRGSTSATTSELKYRMEVIEDGCLGQESAGRLTTLRISCGRSARGCEFYGPLSGGGYQGGSGACMDRARQL